MKTTLIDKLYNNSIADVLKDTQLDTIYSENNSNLDKYRQIIKSRKNEFISILDNKPILIYKLLFIICKDYNNLHLFLEDIEIDIWNLIFKNKMFCDLFCPQLCISTVKTSYIKKIINFITYDKSIYKLYPLNKYLINDEDKLKFWNFQQLCISFCRNYVLSSHYISDYHTIFRLIEKLTLNSFDIPSWERFISYCVIHKPEVIPNYISNYAWVFANLTNIDIRIDLHDILIERRNGVQTKKNKYFSRVHSIFNILIKMSHINEAVKTIVLNIIGSYMHHIVAIHNNIYLLDFYKKNNTHTIDYYNYFDSYNFLPFTDAVKYGDFNCVEWYIDIIRDTNKIKDNIFNLFDEGKWICLFNNPDWRIMKSVLKLIGESMNKSDIKLICNEDFNAIKCVRNLNKKICLFLKFIVTYIPELFINYDSIVKGITTLENENTTNNYKPIFLRKLIEIKLKNPKIQFNVQLYHKEIHYDYINIDEIINIINITNINLLNVKDKKYSIYLFIKNNIINKHNINKKSLKDITDIIIKVVNHVFNEKFSNNEIAKCLKFININKYDINNLYFGGLNIYQIMKQLYNNSIKQSHNNTDTLSNIIELFDCFNNAKTLGIYSLSTTFYIYNQTSYVPQNLYNASLNTELDYYLITNLLKSNYLFSFFSCV